MTNVTMTGVPQADAPYRNSEEWIKYAIVNVPDMGCCSSDLIIVAYAENVWRVMAVLH